MKAVQEHKTKRTLPEAEMVQEQKKEEQILLFPEKLAWVNEMLKTAKFPNGQLVTESAKGIKHSKKADTGSNH